MSKDTGGPAFPAMTAEPIGYGDGFFSTPAPNGEQQFVNTFPGMTLRDYFAAHAPEIPHWFDPTFDEPEPETKMVGFFHTREIGIVEWKAWAKRKSRARTLQWPWYYADAMLIEQAKE